MEITITKRRGNWTAGTVGEYSFEIKHFKNPSADYGIDGGRISKLWVARTRTYGEVACYDRGWDRLPRCDEEIDAVQAVLDKFN